MESKMLQLKDTATRIDVVAIRTNPENDNEDVILNRAGWDKNTVILLNIDDGVTVSYDPYNWPNRTMKVGHKFIEDFWDDIEDYSIINIEKIVDEYNKTNGITNE